jgi:hypothetical protein
MRVRRTLASGLAVSLLFIAAVASIVPRAVHGQEPEELAAFARLIGGRWTLDSTYHVFEWGVGKRSVRSSSYLAGDDGDQLVSEGIWFWHPGEQAIKGFATAVDMGIDVFEYTSHLEGDVLVHELEIYGPVAGENPLRETWTFTDDDHYEWALWEDAGNGYERQMSGVFERTR